MEIGTALRVVDYQPIQRSTSSYHVGDWNRLGQEDPQFQHENQRCFRKSMCSNLHTMDRPSSAQPPLQEPTTAEVIKSPKTRLGCGTPYDLAS